MSRLTDFIAPYRVTDGKAFRLKDVDPDDTGPFAGESKPEAQQLLRSGVERLAALQDRLWAQDRWAVLLIFQAMDAAGKDSAIKHVFSGVNPAGCEVYSFKAPTSLELDHDYMWRHFRSLPERGRIGIFNRSYYEEVLVVRVNPSFLDAQKLPPKVVTKRIWQERYEDIRNLERFLSRNGTVIRKFFLHVSKATQKKRLLERLATPEKNWKFNIADLDARAKWSRHMKAYEDAIRETAARHAPWFVVPADNKWFTRLVVGGAVIEALESLDLHYPRLDEKQQETLSKARAILENE